MALTKIQTVSGNNGAAATTTVAATLAATQPTTLLVAAICCGVNGAAITPPAGWQQVGNLQPTNPNGGTVGLFRFENNPGGITTVTFTITSSLASIVISEYPVPFNAQAFDQASFFSNTNGSNVTLGGSPNFVEMGELVAVAVGYVNATLLTFTGINGYSQDGANIGTAGAGNGAVHLVTNPACGDSSMANRQIGTLSVTPTDGPSIVAGSFRTALIQANNGGIGPYPMVG